MNEHDVTVFVISVGAPTFRACLNAIEQQDCKEFDFDVIKDFAPMSAAFQEMLDRCKTPYFIQVDEDMILRPDAVRRMVQNIKGASPDIALLAHPLWDVHLVRWIYGVKIYRADVVKRFPYVDTQSCEMNQVDRMRAEGYRVESINFTGQDTVYGLHGTSYTPAAAYERYKDLVEKNRKHGKCSWIEEYFNVFWNRLNSNFNPVAYASFAGLVVGSVTHIADAGEKDYREYDRLPGWAGVAMSADDVQDAMMEGPLHACETILTASGIKYAPADVRLLAAKIAAPSEAVLFMTARCNSRCWFCRREQHEAEINNYEDLTPEHVRQFLDRFPTITGACVAGQGEPLLNPHVMDIIKLLASRGLFVSIITNGMALLENIEDLVTSGVDQVSVSLNAASRFEHTAITLTDKWDAVIEAIRESAGRVKTVVSFVVHKQNYLNIPMYIAIGRDLGASAINFMNTLPHFDRSPQDMKDFKDVAIFDTDTEVIETIAACKRQPGADIVTVWPTPIDTSMKIHNCKSPFVSARCAVTFGQLVTGGCRRIAPPTPENTVLDRPSPFTTPNLNELRRSVLACEPQENCKLCFGRVIG